MTPLPARSRPARHAALPFALAALALAACTPAANSPSAGSGRLAASPSTGGLETRFPAAAPARAELRDQEGRVVGTATFTQAVHGLVITAELTGMPPGVHAMHVHDRGQCQPPFTTAGGHYNPLVRSHGIRSANGHHAGDLPNVTIPAGGAARLEVFTRDLTLAPGVGALLDADGSSLLIHSSPDDYASDPAGNAGTRIACGVVTRSEAAASDSTRR